MAFFDSINDMSNFLISFTQNPKDHFGVFAKGYFMAAKKLCEYLLSKNSFSDYEAYPVIFLYRHSLELYLKNVIYKSATLSFYKQIKDLESRLFNIHDLVKLAEIVAALFQKLFPQNNELKNIIENVRVISIEFSSLDANSYAYRYPIDREGNPSTKRNQRVNLNAIYNSLNEILEQFYIIDCGLDIENDLAEQDYEMQKIFEILEDL